MCEQMGNVFNVFFNGLVVFASRSALSDRVWDNRVYMSRRRSVGLEMLENLTELGRGMPAQLSRGLFRHRVPREGLSLLGVGTRT